MKLKICLLSLSLIFIFGNSFGQEESSVFYSKQGKNAKWLSYKNNNQALYKIITDEAFQLLEERAEKVSSLHSVEDWKNYQQGLKTRFFASMNKFEKTPLNPKITGKIKKDTYTVEKVLFESHPDFYVTGCLFIPKKRQKPAPCIIYCSGHTDLAFRSDGYQQVILNLVDKGFVVFGMDPIGQGERLQYLEPETGKSKMGGSTKEHSYAGIQTLLTGTSLSDYFIWDGVRTIDYLLTRKEVDPKRIGITGRSGGGTQTALISAYDERIYAAAPECYITTFKRLLQSIGPQDAEQNPLNAIKLGFDHPDYLHLRAPKPTLIVTTTHDFFSQQGARESYKEAKSSYSAFGKSDNLQMVEDFGVHESTKNNREAVYAFFQKHLENPGDKTDYEVELFAPEELWVTPTGQLQSSIKGQTTFTLNQKYYSKTELPKNELKSKIQSVSGISFESIMTAAVYTGKFSSGNYIAEKYFLENNKDDFALPVYLIKKDDTNPKKTLVWLHPKGKSEIFNNEELIHFLNNDYAILTCDLTGIGELNDPQFRGDGIIQGVPFNYTFGAHLVGKTIPGIQAESIDLLMQFEKQRKESKHSIHALIEGELNSTFLHYTAFRNPFSKIVFMNPIESASALVSTEFYNPEEAYNIVPGSLPYYDLKDLRSFLPFYTQKTVKWGDENGKTEKVAFEETLELLKK